MFKNYKLSDRPVHHIYAFLWLLVFAYFTYLIYSGEIFEAVHGKVHIVAILLAWIVGYIGLTATSLLCFSIGLIVAFKISFVK